MAWVAVTFRAATFWLQNREPVWADFASWKKIQSSARIFMAAFLPYNLIVCKHYLPLGNPA
jgi:hypothetical protein